MNDIQSVSAQWLLDKSRNALEGLIKNERNPEIKRHVQSEFK
jgi:hypothetical protein